MSRWLWQWLRLPGWPVLPRWLWLMLAGLVFCISNELLIKELWPHVPAAKSCFLVGAWLSVICVLPSLLWVGWRWLLAWQGPILLRCLATAVFLVGAGVAGLLWLLLAAGGLGILASGQLLAW